MTKSRLSVWAAAAAVGALLAASAQAQGAKNVLVGFHSAPGPAQVQLIESLGGRVTHTYKYIPVVAATIPESQVAALAAAPGVAYVEDDHLLFPLAGKQITDYGVSKIEAPAAWSLGVRGDGIKVGIFDSGIDIDHPDLKDAIDGGVDLVGDGRGLDDCNGHGTHVAGIVGARNNGHGTVGVAPRSRLYSMRFADCNWAGATRSKEIQALEWAIDNGIQVINMSFGCCGVAGVHVPIPSQAEEAALNAAYERGIVLIAASGNSSYPVVAFPAGYANVIAVGATDDEDNLATFSQWGEQQELTAPGVANLSSVPVGTGLSTDLTVPTDNARELEAIAMQFSGMTKKQGVTADTIYAGLGTPAEFAGINCAGKTALITRGGLTFAEKTTNAMNAGCVAAIVHNNQPGNFNGTLGAEGNWIPVVSISLDEGLYLKNQIDSQPTTTTLINVAGNHAIFSGTSMASPHAAGVTALIRQKCPGATPDQVRRILRQSVDDRGVPGWDPIFGYGRVNARKAAESSCVTTTN